MDFVVAAASAQGRSESDNRSVGMGAPIYWVVVGRKLGGETA